MEKIDYRNNLVGFGAKMTTLSTNCCDWWPHHKEILEELKLAFSVRKDVFHFTGAHHKLLVQLEHVLANKEDAIAIFEDEKDHRVDHFTWRMRFTLMCCCLSSFTDRLLMRPDAMRLQC